MLHRGRCFIILLIALTIGQTSLCQRSGKLLDFEFYPTSLINTSQRNVEAGIVIYPTKWLEASASLGIGFIEQNYTGFRKYYKARYKIFYRLPVINPDNKVVCIGIEYTDSNGETTRENNYFKSGGTEYAFDRANHARQVQTLSGLASFAFHWPKYSIEFTVGIGSRWISQSLDEFVNLREERDLYDRGPLFTFGDSNINPGQYDQGHVAAQIALKFPLIKRKNQE